MTKSQKQHAGTHGANNGRGANNFRKGRNPQTLLTTYQSPSYANQQIVSMRLPGTHAYLTGASSTGLIAFNFSQNLAGITGLSRFTSTFDEYRILGVDIELICGNPTSGVTAFFWDEHNNGTPSVNDALERECVFLTNNACNSRSVRTLSWRARDLTDLQFDDISATTNTPVWFSIFTDATNFGSGTTVGTDNAQWFVKPYFYIEFRGLQAL